MWGSREVSVFNLTPQTYINTELVVSVLIRFRQRMFWGGSVIGSSPDMLPIYIGDDTGGLVCRLVYRWRCFRCQWTQWSGHTHCARFVAFSLGFTSGIKPFRRFVVTCPVAAGFMEQIVLIACDVIGFPVWQKEQYGYPDRQSQ